MAQSTHSNSKQPELSQPKGKSLAFRSIGDGFVFKHQGDFYGTWRVMFNDRLTTPLFNSQGAANAYLAMLNRGQRKPEYRT